MRTTFFTWLSAVCLLGCAGTGSDPCAAAIEHVTACTGVEVKADEIQCNADTAAAIAGTDCADLLPPDGKTDFVGWIKGLFDREPTMCERAQSAGGICINGGFKWSKVECNEEQLQAAKWVLSQSWSDLCQNRDPEYRRLKFKMGRLIGSNVPDTSR